MSETFTPDTLVSRLRKAADGTHKERGAVFDLTRADLLEAADTLDARTQELAETNRALDATEQHAAKAHELAEKYIVRNIAAEAALTEARQAREASQAEAEDGWKLLDQVAEALGISDGGGEWDRTDLVEAARNAEVK